MSHRLPPAITFRYDLKAKETRAFEKAYEKSLQLDDDEKQPILDRGLAVWMYVGKDLVGETYGIRVEDDDEEIEDTAGRDPRDVYCYSTTILPKFQGKGYGKLLKAFWLGYVWAKRPGCTIIGHASSPAMLQINLQFGATVLAVHDGWYGTKRKAFFYEIEHNSTA
jgi:GNAT superfamily N-acetyltransferase